MFQVRIKMARGGKFRRSLISQAENQGSEASHINQPEAVSHDGLTYAVDEYFSILF